MVAQIETTGLQEFDLMLRQVKEIRAIRGLANSGTSLLLNAVGR